MSENNRYYEFEVRRVKPEAAVDDNGQLTDIVKIKLYDALGHSHKLNIHRSAFQCVKDEDFDSVIERHVCGQLKIVVTSIVSPEPDSDDQGEED